MAQRTLENTLAKLDNVISLGDGYKATCPAHNDNQQSLSVRAGNKLPVVLKCFAGCGFNDIWDILEGRAQARHENGSEPKAQKQPKKRQQGKLVAEYEWTDAEGNLLFVKGRFEPKDFRNKRPDGKGGWIYKNVFDGVPKVLYHLPEVLATASTGGTVYVVEGEKDVENVRKLGATATCSRNGGEWASEYANQLTGAVVVVVADKDKTGYAHARKVRDSLEGKALSVRIVEARTGKDVSDHLAAGLGLDELVDVSDASERQAQPENEQGTALPLKVRGVLQAEVLLQAIKDMGPIAVDDGKNLFAYEDGYWRYIEQGDEITRRTYSLLRNDYRAQDDNTMMKVLRAQRPSWTNATLDTQYLNLPNGLLDWRTGALKAHSPEVASLNRIPVRWEPNATCPQVDTWMTEVFAPDVIPMVWEIIGYSLYNDNPLHKAVLLHGTGRNGKGTFLRILNALIGTDNISSVTPQSLDDNRFRAAELHGKLANLVGDVDPRIFAATEIFKQVTGGDLVTVERKHEHPFKFTPRALMMAAFNALPRTADATEGFFSRWIVLPFSGYFPAGKADPTLSQRLTSESELQGVLVQAVAGLQRLMERGKFEEPESVTEAMREFRSAADPVRQWMQEETIGEEEAVTLRSDFYEAYRQWVDDGGNKPLSRANFLERVMAAASEVYGVQLDVRRRKQGYVVMGVRLARGDTGDIGDTDFEPLPTTPETKVRNDVTSITPMSPPQVRPQMADVTKPPMAPSFLGDGQRGKVRLSTTETRTTGADVFGWMLGEENT